MVILKIYTPIYSLNIFMFTETDIPRLITPTLHTVPIEQINEILQTDFITDLMNNSENNKVKAEINQPTGNFFYDPWVIKKEFQNTVFEYLLNSLPYSVGEARFIVLKPGSCYHSHADIDDRYHLNIQGQYSYLIDLENNIMFPTNTDGQWYDMNAGIRHVASNFGSINRVQLVVRKLLKQNQLTKPISIKVNYVGSTVEKSRFIFDDRVSPWLNSACKNKIISNFKTDQKQIWFDIELNELVNLKNMLGTDFNIEEV
jgi:hypothetical protein